MSVSRPVSLYLSDKAESLYLKSKDTNFLEEHLESRGFEVAYSEGIPAGLHFNLPSDRTSEEIIMFLHAINSETVEFVSQKFPNAAIVDEAVHDLGEQNFDSTADEPRVILTFQRRAL